MLKKYLISWFWNLKLLSWRSLGFKAALPPKYWKKFSRQKKIKNQFLPEGGAAAPGKEGHHVRNTAHRDILLGASRFQTKNVSMIEHWCFCWRFGGFHGWWDCTLSCKRKKADVRASFCARDNLRGQKSRGPLKMSREMDHKVILPPQKNYIQKVS